MGPCITDKLKENRKMALTRQVPPHADAFIPLTTPAPYDLTSHGAKGEIPVLALGYVQRGVLEAEVIPPRVGQPDVPAGLRCQERQALIGVIQYPGSTRVEYTMLQNQRGAWWTTRGGEGLAG